PLSHTGSRETSPPNRSHSRQHRNPPNSASAIENAPRPGGSSVTFTRLITRWLKKSLQPTRPIEHSTRLTLDVLEARQGPATFKGKSLLDTGSVGTLRWAINASNAATAQPNTISITRAAAGQVKLTAALPTIIQPVTIANNSGGTFTINGQSKFQIFVIAA